MFKAAVVLGTILATGWLASAQADDSDWEIFSKKICELAIYKVEDRPSCVKDLIGRTGENRNYLRTVQHACIDKFDLMTDTYGIGVFMNRTIDCYEGGLKMIDIPNAFAGSPESGYQDAIQGCSNHGDFGWIVRCFDNLVNKMIAEGKGYESSTSLVSSVRPLVTSRDVHSPHYAPAKSIVDMALKKQLKKEPQMGNARSWSCALNGEQIRACTVHLDLPHDWCYSGHFVLKLEVDSTTGKPHVTHYDWTAGN